MCIRTTFIHNHNMCINLHTIHAEYIDIQMMPNASLKKLIAFYLFCLFILANCIYQHGICTHPSLLLIKLMSVKCLWFGKYTSSNITVKCCLIGFISVMITMSSLWIPTIYQDTSFTDSFFVLELCSLNVWNNKRSLWGSTICFTLSLILQLH